MEYQIEKRKKARIEVEKKLVNLWHDTTSWEEFKVKADVDGLCDRWHTFLFWSYMVKKERPLMWKASMIAIASLAAVCALGLIVVPIVLGHLELLGACPFYLAFVAFCEIVWIRQVLAFHSKLSYFERGYIVEEWGPILSADGISVTIQMPNYATVSSCASGKASSMASLASTRNLSSSI